MLILEAWVSRFWERQGEYRNGGSTPDIWQETGLGRHWQNTWGHLGNAIVRLSGAEGGMYRTGHGLDKAGRTKGMGLVG